MDNVKDNDIEIIFSPDDEMKDFVADNPVTHALFSHLVDELTNMNIALDDWVSLTDITLAAAGFCFFKAGGTPEEFLKKLMSVDIKPDKMELN